MLSVTNQILITKKLPTFSTSSWQSVLEHVPVTSRLSLQYIYWGKIFLSFNYQSRYSEWSTLRSRKRIEKPRWRVMIALRRMKLSSEGQRPSPLSLQMFLKSTSSPSCQCLCLPVPVLHSPHHRTVYWKKPSSLVKLAIALISSIFSSLECITKYYCNDNKLKTFKDIILNTIIENSNIGFHISDLSARLKSSLQLSSSFVSK